MYNGPLSPKLRLFVLVALTATGIDLLAYNVLSRTGLGWFVADVIALGAAATFGISMHRRFTLRNDPNVRWIHRRVAFLSSAMIAGTLDLAVLWLSDDRGTSAKLTAIAVAAVVRAAMHRWFLFRVVRSEQSQPARRQPSKGSLRLSVVIPAYKEKKRISKTVDAVYERLALDLDPSEFEIVVVDDGSGDGTARAAEATGRAYAFELPRNLGKGGAVRAGMLRAQGRTRVFLDADLAYAPTEILRLLTEIESGWDVAVGTRRANGILSRTSAGLVRDLGGRAVNLATQLLLLGHYRDTQAGCKGFRGDVADAVFGAGQLNGFSFDVELFHLVERWKLTLSEIPMTVAETEASTVSLVRDTTRLLRDIAKIRRFSARGVYARKGGASSLPAPILAND